MSQSFSADWEPKMLREEVLAEGTWRFQDRVEYVATLYRRTYNYTSFDIEPLEAIVHPEVYEWLILDIGDTGQVYVWTFIATGSTPTSYPGQRHDSAYLGTYFLACDHLNGYEGTHAITWYDPREGRPRSGRR